MSVQPVTPAPDAGALALPTVTGGGMPGLAVISEWLTAAQTAEQLVTPLITSSFVPDAFKPRVGANATDVERREAFETARANATSAVLLGLSLGLDPLTALQQIYVVKGRPGMYAKLKVALAQARGHRVWDEEYSAEKVTVAGQRKGSDDVVRITLTMADAKRASWTDNAAYSKTPADMLWARCASRVVDRIAADVLMGIASIEDLDDLDEPAPAAARVTIGDVRGTAPAPAPVAVEAAPAAAAPAAAAPVPGAEPLPLIDERTSAAINTEFVRLGVTGPGVKERRRRAVARIISRPEIATARELTQVEGDLVLDVLQGLKRGQPALHNLLAEDGEPLQAAGQGATLAQTTGEPQAGEQVGTFLPPRPGDVDLGDADPDGDVDVPEPDNAERAAAPVVGEEPDGWR